MALTPSTFESIVPSRYIVFTIPHPANHHPLRIAVLDSPSADVSTSNATATAAMWVPFSRDSDWIFSTFYGHLQLMLSSPSPTSQPLSRLILIGNSPASPHPVSYNSSTIDPSISMPQQNLMPLLVALTPKSAPGEIPQVPFLVYEDEVGKSSILEICEGPCVGEILIENVELENDGDKEFRRRLRFKRMPNFVQTQVRIHPKGESKLESLDHVEFELDRAVLVQPYLSPMVAGISVISKFLEAQMRVGIKPKALCLGVGGGALIGFLSAQLNLEVVGVEEDEVVLQVAKKYFGLESDEFIHLIAGDGIKYVKDLSKNSGLDSRFHVVMVDLDSNDVMLGVCAPPLEFITNSVLVAIKAVLCDEGVVVINTIPSSKLSYARLISEIHSVFEELYQIDVGNEENFVLIATKSEMEDSLDAKECSFLDKLKLVVSRSYIDSIRKIPKFACCLPNRLDDC